jgi:hypothetical protein
MRNPGGWGGLVRLSLSCIGINLGLLVTLSLSKSDG